MSITAVGVLFFIKFQDMAKQINNFKKARRDRIECEKLFSKTQVFTSAMFISSVIKILNLKRDKFAMNLNFFHFSDRWTFSIIFGKYNTIKPLFSVWLSHLPDPILLQYALNFHRIERDFFSHHSSGNRSVIAPIYNLEPPLLACLQYWLSRTYSTSVSSRSSRISRLSVYSWLDRLNWIGLLWFQLDVQRHVFKWLSINLLTIHYVFTMSKPWRFYLMWISNVNS